MLSIQKHPHIVQIWLWERTNIRNRLLIFLENTEVAYPVCCLKNGVFGGEHAKIEIKYCFVHLWMHYSNKEMTSLFD